MTRLFRFQLKAIDGEIEELRREIEAVAVEPEGPANREKEIQVESHRLNTERENFKQEVSDSKHFQRLCFQTTSLKSVHLCCKREILATHVS